MTAAGDRVPAVDRACQASRSAVVRAAWRRYRRAAGARAADARAAPGARDLAELVGLVYESVDARYNAVNPWMKQRPDLLVPGRVATSEEMCPTDVLRRSEYDNDSTA